ncbi:hypothetical protein CIHG_09352 [Coccidioides immitis H538.4]|uniref:Uncharacterized protein n=3 Tax=Coccidioides immitis TaxID=5501 RepID=A0A0J8QWG2_COCIT|nr:hypothetical protein CIRG_02513 [Coccidioides immitis RMSCC 2394]KMU77209.1 hypothetical protein CISG_06053 [Coccidioides immitis RMSCC 3703]KMU91542.1 hypothetical protein CIHG_09352 [Coccidioides immitis H538.4]
MKLGPELLHEGVSIRRNGARNHEDYRFSQLSSSALREPTKTLPGNETFRPEKDPQNSRQYSGLASLFVQSLEHDAGTGPCTVDPSSLKFPSQRSLKANICTAPAIKDVESDRLAPSKVE